MGLSNAQYLRRQQESESNARTYPRHFPLAIRHAEGIHLTDVDGRVFLDCLAGAGSLALGHNHPVVVEALRAHLDQGLPLHTLDLTTPVKDEFVATLLGGLPPELAKVHFCGPSGADAVEAALKLVKTATGRRGVLAFRGGYHGQTHGALSLMGDRGPKAAIAGLMPEVHFLPFPSATRCPLGCAGRCDGSDVSTYIEEMLDDPCNGFGPIAGLIVEVVQGQGGCNPAPDRWLCDLRRITADRGIPLIVDEVQTGWGRAGKPYAFQHAGIVPDVVVLSKAIGGGLPLAVIVYRPELDVWQPGAHAGTFRGNQLAMAAGIATWRHLIDNDLSMHAETMGARIRSGLAGLGEVRGRGLLLGLQIEDRHHVDSHGRPMPDGATAAAIRRECFRRGLIAELGGRFDSVLRLTPPLTITAEQADAVTGIVRQACAAVLPEVVGV